MIRRWSYLDNSCSSASNSRQLLKVYFKKTFKTTVRFKRLTNKLSKISRKKYNFRKLVNTNFPLVMYAYRWVKFYRNTLLVKKIQQSYRLFPVTANKAAMNNARLATLVSFSSAASSPLAVKSILSTNHLAWLCASSNSAFFTKNSSIFTVIPLYESITISNTSILISKILLIRKLCSLGVLLYSTKKMIFLKHLSYTKLKPTSVTSGASRGSTSTQMQFLLNKKCKSLSTKVTWRSGITKGGRISVKSKGRKILKAASHIINYSSFDNSLHFLYSLNLSKTKPFPHALFFSSSGKCSYVRLNTTVPSTSLYKTSQAFNRLSICNPLLKAHVPFLVFSDVSTSIFRVTFMSLVSSLQLKLRSPIKFSRSFGSKATLLRKSSSSPSVMMKLPSGVKKIFSSFSTCMVEAKSSSLQNPLVYKTKKLNYFKGLAPRSRGVAKNPVDHPHGGRTKSIKYPRTPWGKTTKFK